MNVDFIIHFKTKLYNKKISKHDSKPKQLSDILRTHLGTIIQFLDFLKCYNK